MLLSVKGMGQLIYSGARQAPGYTAPCFDPAPSFLFSGRNTTAYSNSLPPINVGEYTMTITFNCTVNQTVINYSIDKATPTLSVTNSPLTYTGSAQSAALGNSVPGIISSIKYNGSSTLPINAATYAMTADFVPTDATNYNSLTGAYAGNFTIVKATPTITVTPGSYTYNGTPQGPGVTETTTGGSTSVPTFSYVGTGGTTYPSSSTKPTNAGTYLVTASVITDANN